MKRKITILIIALMVLSVASNTAKAQDSLSYYTFGWYNCSMYGDVGEMIDEFIENRTVVIEVNPFISPSTPDMDQPSLGIGVLMIHFNRALAPVDGEFNITLNDESVLDMLINFTYVDGHYKSSPTSGEIYESKYLLAYVYLFANHSVYNPATIDINVGPEHNVPSTFLTASTGGSNDVSLRMSYMEPVNDTTTPTTPTVSDTTSYIITSVIISGVLIMVIVLFIIVMRRRR